MTMELMFRTTEDSCDLELKLGAMTKDMTIECRYPVSSKSEPNAKGKLSVMRGRKATGPNGPAALPNGPAATRFVGAQAGKAEPVLRFLDEGR